MPTSQTHRNNTTAPHLPSRREFIRVGFAGALGLGVGDWLALQALADAGNGAQPAAKGVIQIFLEGGLSHLDSFDPKPDAPIEVRGELGAVDTVVPGLRFGGLWRETAKITDRLAVIRSMNHSEAAHERGTHNMLTGYRPNPAIVYPSMGSVVSRVLGGRNDLPAYVAVPNARGGNGFAGTGYLSAAYGPFSVGGEPNRGDFEVRDLNLPAGVDEQRMNRRRSMLQAVDEHFKSIESSDALDAMDSFYSEAYRLISSESARAAFDIHAEPKEIRDAYGRTQIGQRLLLARRLIEGGVRFTTVFYGGWDMHKDIHPAMRRHTPPLDQAFAQLIRDLEQRGLLKDTIVLITTEFGRTMRINADRGRDHWPKAFSIALAGGGIAGGRVIGSTNAEGAEVDDYPVSPGDVAATLFAQLGIDPNKRLIAPGNRPLEIMREGEPLAALT